jgi:hypothetical protein
MNGNAEGYFLYGFEQMDGVTCTSGDQTVHIDFFRMESPELAYGIFTANRHPRHPVVELGMAGQIMPRRATFAKGAYYVELAANSDAPDELATLAKALEPTVPGTGDPPVQPGWFPPDGLDPESVRLVPQSLMGLRIFERGYIGSYDDGRAFLVEAASAEEAKALMEKFAADLADSQPLELGDEAVEGVHRYIKHTLLARKGARLVGFSSREPGASGASRVEAFLDRIP